LNSLDVGSHCGVVGWGKLPDFPDSHSVMFYLRVKNYQSPEAPVGAVARIWGLVTP
jgi:hypothetical protein